MAEPNASCALRFDRDEVFISHDWRLHLGVAFEQACGQAVSKFLYGDGSVSPPCGI